MDGPSKGIREPHEVKKISFDLGVNRTYKVKKNYLMWFPDPLY